MWAYVDKKRVLSCLVGKRNAVCANNFMRNMSARLANRVQLSSDAVDYCADVVEPSSGAEIDYGWAARFYEAEPILPPVVATGVEQRLRSSQEHEPVMRSGYLLRTLSNHGGVCAIRAVRVSYLLAYGKNSS